TAIPSSVDYFGGHQLDSIIRFYIDRQILLARKQPNQYDDGRNKEPLFGYSATHILYFILEEFNNHILFLRQAFCLFPIVSLAGVIIDLPCADRTQIRIHSGDIEERQSVSGIGRSVESRRVCPVGSIVFGHFSILSDDGNLTNFSSGQFGR